MFIDKINKNYDKLNDTDRHVLELIFQQGDKLNNLTVEEFAAIANVSKSSVIRFTQKLGFSGFSEFKNYLKWNKKENADISEEDYISILTDDLHNTIQQSTDSSQLKKIVEKIIASDRIIIYGTGTAQQFVAMELQRLFLQANKHMYCTNAIDEFRIATRSLTENDLVIVISLSGSVMKIIDVLNTLKLKKVSICSITNFTNNQLSSLADYRLYATSTSKSLTTSEEDHNSFVTFYLVIEMMFREYLNTSQKESDII